MAVDSLRYHLSPQCVVDNEHNRERYEALPARLQEPSPRPTPEEQAGIDTWKPLSDPVCTSKGKVLSDYRGGRAARVGWAAFADRFAAAVRPGSVAVRAWGFGRAGGRR
jgi:hypothetical protein